MGVMKQVKAKLLSIVWLEVIETELSTGQTGLASLSDKEIRGWFIAGEVGWGTAANRPISRANIGSI